MSQTEDQLNWDRNGFTMVYEQGINVRMFDYENDEADEDRTLLGSYSLLDSD